MTFGTVFGWHAAAAFGYVIWALTLPAHNPDGSCEGIGWGCTLPPREAALLLGAFIGAPLILVSIGVAMAIGAWIALRYRTTPVRAGTVATFVAVPATAVGALVVYVTSPF
jgi:hypothetical protein